MSCCSGLRILLATLASFAIAACANVPAPRPVALTAATPVAMVATIRAAAGHDPGELAVQPLRDPMVEDLRQRATRLQAQREYGAAAAALDQALAIVPEDPALLQERAEAAVLLQDFDTAEKLARRAYQLGAKVGPLCRRHWATVQQARLIAGDATGAAAAKAQVVACKVAGPNRF
ncbi:MAG: hypothetical protein LC715_03110 [Gammaproteobacteria bacterium]|nr:hypothetical protein [Gammaproteobacteria bacterium]